MSRFQYWMSLPLARIAQRMGNEPMAEKKKAGRPGRKPPPGDRKQLLMSMDSGIIRRIKGGGSVAGHDGIAGDGGGRRGVARSASGRQEVGAGREPSRAKGRGRHHEPQDVHAMTNASRPDAQTFAQFMASLPRHEIERVNELNRQEASEQHKAFSEAFKAGSCSFCGGTLASFDADRPCRHWLLKPEGVRKEHIERLATDLSWSILENYVRWVANEEAFAQNINDLADEGTGKLLELTVKYKNLEWSFSCGATDLAGHEGGGDHSKVPHWHFQMYVDGKPFVRYNDYHLPLSEAEAGFLEFMRAHPGKVHRRLVGGAGMSEVFHESMLEEIVATGRSGETDEDVEKAPIKLDTIIMADPGTTIRGEDIYNLIQAAREQGVTATSKMRELKNVRVTTTVSAGPGVVRQAPRSGRKKGRDKEANQRDRAWREQRKRET
jgi:hypothetical protein